MIISLHIPKSAGTSFGMVLKDHFGDGLLLDYGTRPLEIPFSRGRKKAETFSKRINIRKYHSVKCIHGHFLAVKYSALSDNAKFITWLRNPVDRLVSDYQHILRSQDRYKKTITYMVKREKLSIEEFCFHPLLQNYCQNFLWNFSIEKFQFIGIVENYFDDLKYFNSNYLHSSTNLYMENKNPSEEGYHIDQGMRKDLEKFHNKDMGMYNHALEISLSRK